MLKKNKLNEIKDQTFFQLDEDKELEIQSNNPKLFKGVNSLLSITYGINYIGSIPSLITYFNYSLENESLKHLMQGFIIGILLQFMTSLSLAEICSAYPQNGSVYQWSKKLNNNNQSKLIPFQVGFCYLIGCITTLTTNCIASATILNQILKMYNPDWNLNIEYQVYFAILIILLCVLINYMRIDDMTWINHFTLIQTLSFLITILIVIVYLAPAQQQQQFIFGDFINEQHIKSNFNYIILGIIISIYCLTGIDSAGQIADETHDPSTNSPNGIIQSVVWSSMMTFSFILIIIYQVGGSSSSAVFVQENTDNFIIGIIRNQFQNPNLIIFLSYNLIFMLIFNGVSTVTGLSRIILQMCENKCFPFSQYFAVISKKNYCPYRILVLILITQIFLCSLIIYSQRTFYSLGNICTACWQISYFVVIAQKLYNNQNFQNNKFSLGSYSKLLNWLCLIWLSISTFIILLPNQLNSRKELVYLEYNYTSIIIITFLSLSFLYYQLIAKFTIKYID